MKRYLFISLFCFVSLLSLQAATYSGSLPVLHIQTENNAPIESKEVYINATYYLDAMNLTGYQSIGSAAAPLAMQIRGRGNWTWKDFDKKPYRIKLADKQPLLGMTKSKHFALLAHADDSKGFMRNTIGFELSRLIGMTWTPDAKPIEVVLNGEYKGLYFLTETIRVDEDRVNIVEQEDEATDATAITGGWLVEIDNYNSDPHITIQEGGSTTMWITYKTPEVLSTEQEQFLTAEMTRIDQLVYGDKNSDELWQYLDIDALARFYIVQELTDNYESFHGSCYLHREQGEGQKWHFGPVWDFGSSFNRDKSQYMFEGKVWHNHWIPQICQFPAFQAHLGQVWTEFYDGAFDSIYTYIDQQKQLIASAAAADYERWPQYGNNNLDNRVNGVTDRLRKNAAWLHKQWTGEDDGTTTNPEDDTVNPEYNPADDNGIMTMYVWQNGEKKDFPISDVDSVTFAEDKGIVIKCKVPASWPEPIYIWIWGDDVHEGDYEHLAKKQGDWYVFTRRTDKLNIIFKTGKGWTGHANQSEDLKTDRSGCYILTQEGDEKAVFTETDCE